MLLLKSEYGNAVIFADLDGSFINEEYSYAGAQQAVHQLLSLKVPLVFCSSKTSEEIEHYRNELGVTDPFCSENGAAVFIPKQYFSFDYEFNRRTENYNVLELGISYQKLRKALAQVRMETGFEIVGFGDMTIEEVAKETGLSIELAKLSKRREYDEPFRVFQGDEKQVIALFEREGLTVTRGDRYFHLTGRHNKRDAAALLRKLYLKRFGKVWTFGVGNGPNDLDMLKWVDEPFFVENAVQIAEVWDKILAKILHSGSGET
jgi:mannosyl-3-phosphoglycerate phosphatase